LCVVIEDHSRATAAGGLERVRVKLKETTWQRSTSRWSSSAPPPGWPRG
jgi:hypothetical protein